MRIAAAKQTTDGQRIRGPGLAILISGNEGAPYDEGLMRADAGNLVIASNKRMSRMLIWSDEWKTKYNLFGCWTGTTTAYEEAGKAFGRLVEYTDEKAGIRYIFPVPDEFVGATDCLLVAEHPDFTLERKGNDRIVRAARIALIERFPAENGWYPGDDAYDIPNGDAVDSSGPGARRLWRIGGARVGPVARGYGGDNDKYDGRRDIVLNGRPCGALGMAVEAPLGRRI
ncbi:hypothetical protein H0O00_00210 [Candidatus Micrarchaeota archaeon]|nr:hypothetical protein [Candidatus Micrarchaeota archaeon]